MSTRTRRAELAAFREQYHPPETGLHICGFEGVGRFGPEFTIFARSMSPEDARHAFEATRKELAEPDGEDFDVIVDLCVDGDTVDDFCMRRQMVDRFKGMMP